MLRAIIEFQRRQGAAQTGVIQPRDDAFRALSEFNGPRGMRTSYRLIDWLKKPPIEDFRSYPYDDASRPPNATIGYGHKLHPGPVNHFDLEKFKHGITEAPADRTLRDDLRKAEDEVNRYVTVPLNQSQFDALVSLTYSVGGHEFERSTLLRMLNTGDYLGAADQFPSWVRAGKTHPPGLRTRRQEERGFFLRR